jgi:general secretion pathway protein M
MRIREQLPTLDAALVRFDAWWNGLSPRERTMVGGLGALLALVLLVFVVIKPLQAARAQALADIRTYETLSARIRAAGALTAAPATRREGPPAQVATSSATAFGLTVTPEPIDGGIRVTLADASYDSLMAWLADLGATSNLRVRSLQLTRQASPGRVSGTVDFAQ